MMLMKKLLFLELSSSHKTFILKLPFVPIFMILFIPIELFGLKSEKFILRAKAAKTETNNQWCGQAAIGNSY